MMAGLSLLYLSHRRFPPHERTLHLQPVSDEKNVKKIFLPPLCLKEAADSGIHRMYHEFQGWPETIHSCFSRGDFSGFLMNDDDK